MNRLFDVNVSQSMRLSLIAGCILSRRQWEYPHRLGAIQIVAVSRDARWSVAEDGPERLRASLAFILARRVMFTGDVSVAHGTSSFGVVYAL
jgi:hypothetical protein